MNVLLSHFAGHLLFLLVSSLLCLIGNGYKEVEL